MSIATSVAGKGLRRPMRWLLRLARWLVGLVALAWIVLLIAWAVLQWAILPHIDEWRGRVEKEATAALRVPVRIQRIEVSSGGWMPTLSLDQVELLDPQGRVALSLPRVTAVLSARSILSWSLRFEQLLIERPQLVIRRDAQGRISIGGLALDQAGQTVSSERADALADWIFSQREFAITYGRIRWIDEQRAAPPLELADLHLVLRNGLRSHSLRLDATPPPAWGERFSLRGNFTQALLKRPGELRWWTGQLYADLPRADLRELRRHVDLPFELDEGDGALRAWVDVQRGQPTGATVDLALRSVHMRLVPNADPLRLAHIEGRVQLRQDVGSLALQATQLGFEALQDDGADQHSVVWPRSNWGVTLRIDRHGAAQLADARLLGGTASAERLDFALMAQIAERLPVGKQVRDLLDQLQPQGVLSDFSAQWDGSLEAPSHYRFGARIDGLSVHARLPAEGATIGQPGIDGASLTVQADEHGGQAQFAIDKGGIEIPGLFEEPRLPVNSLEGQLQWQVTPAQGRVPQRIAIDLKNLQFANDDLAGRFDIGWHSSATALGRIDLHGHIDHVAATRVQRYLPLSIPSARDYVRAAILGGDADDIQVRLAGELDDFPFDKPVPRGTTRGEFRISTQARDVNLAYVPPDPGQPLAWPAFTQVNAQLVFERGAMLIQDGRAHALGYELSGVNGGIKDLGHKQVLELEGSGRGPLAELLGFVHASPIDGWTGHALTQATASGNAGLHLGLRLPLNDMDHSTVKGSVQLADDELRLRADVPVFSALQARVDFDTKGVTVSHARAQALGGELAFDGGTQADGSLRFTGNGTATAEGLRHASELGALAQLARSMQGQAGYQIHLGFGDDGQTALDVASTLQGLALDLPAPLHKAATAPLPLHVQLLPQGATHDELHIELAGLLQAQYLRDTSGTQSHVLRGALGVQTAAPALPAHGVVLDARLGDANLDSWLALAHGLDTGSGSGLDAGYAPTDLSIRARSLQLFGRPLNQLDAHLERVGAPDGGALVRVALTAEQLAGRIELEFGRAGSLRRVQSRLAHLSLPKQDADSVTQFLDQDLGAQRQLDIVPTLDIAIDDFELRGKKLGRLEIQAQADAATRDWKLGKLELSGPDATLTASGDWGASAGGPRRTQLDWTLDVRDGGATLERLGQGQVLRGGKGRLSGTLGWLGSPLTPEFAAMDGRFSVKLDAGQFLKAEPGVGRLLGVLSLQSLPRRLLFDFRDVFSEGFAFDDVSGNVEIVHGVARSSDLKMHGVQATVSVAGSTDLAAETQDLRIVVVPEFNAGGASLAYAAVNPAIGLGAFLAQFLLSKPINEAGTREFHITGGWTDPKVEKVDKVEHDESANHAAPAQESP
ncbi:MAG: TIGR02099 family protein [Paucibacter sp.]|nr:TIGR02099 family protein [Roseateles sp.]